MLKAKPQEYTFLYNEQKIAYRLVFDKYKTVRLRLIAPYFLEIKMPVRTPHRYAEQSILKHIDWILSQSEQFQKQTSDTQTILPFTKELFIFGKAFPVHSQTSACTQKEKLLFTAQNTFFNQEQVFLHALPILQNSHTAVSLTNAEIFVQCRDEGDCARKLTAWRKKTALSFLSWYYQQLWQVFQEKTAHFLIQHPIKTSYHLACPPLSFRSCKRCFGSCKISPKTERGGRAACIMLSTHLMGLPLEYIEFVILHEFCHLIFHNHSPHFYALLDLVLPRHRIMKTSVNHWSKTHISF